MISTRSLGTAGPDVGCIGYGAMVLEGYYGGSKFAADPGTIEKALDLGMNMIDTADTYGNGSNEQRVGRAVKGRRDDAFIATKFGVVFEDSQPGTGFSTGWDFSIRLNGTPGYAARAVDESLRRLGVDVIDLWYLHYPDPSTPVEESVGAMAKAVQAGKVRYLGLSNVTADEIRRAHEIHPIAVVQYEYSLWRREAESELLPTLRELGIALVAWSPLGSGFLAGAGHDLDSTDFRSLMPRFSKDNLQVNLDRFSPLMELAGELGVTPAQLALSWMLHQGPDIIPIPGTSRLARVEENARSSEIRLDADTLRRIDELARPGLARGGNLL